MSEELENRVAKIESDLRLVQIHINHYSRVMMRPTLKEMLEEFKTMCTAKCFNGPVFTALERAICRSLDNEK